MRSVFILAAVSVLVVACNKRGSLDSIGGPSWIFDPYAVSKNKNELAAVGMSEKSHAGLKMQLAQAENDAMGNLASQIQTKVDKAVEDFVEQNIAINAQNSAKADGKEEVQKNEDVKKKFSAVTKSIVDKLPISGATRTDIWQDPNSGTLYVRMAIDQSKVQNYFKNSVGMYNSVGALGVKKDTIDQLNAKVLGAVVGGSEKVAEGNNATAAQVAQ